VSPSPVKLLCFPPAGAGPSFFAPWINAHPELDVVPVDLPGREYRFAEEPCATIPELVDAILPSVRATVRQGTRVALFGHCFGALVAYHVAMTLFYDDPRTALALCASASGVPGVTLGTPATGLADDEFLGTVERNIGYSHPAMEEPELRELLLPALRADVAAYEAYQSPWPLTVPFPMIIVRGRKDPFVSAADAVRWGEISSRRASFLEVDGGHMYVSELGAAVLPDLARLVTEAVAVA
jgi:surfactin synthase thioesterase subunit